MGGILGISVVSCVLALFGGFPVVALAVALMLGVAASRYPMLLLPGVVAGILLSNFGLVPSVVIVVPITLGKTTTLAAMVLWGGHAWYYGKPMFRWTSVSVGFIVIGAAMLINLVASAGDVRSAAPAIIGYVSLALLTHLIVVWVPRVNLDDALLLVAGVLAVVMAFGVLTTDRIESVYSGRASGVYDSPNLWCAILIWLVPLVVGTVQNRGRIGLIVTGILLFLYPLNIALSLSRGGAIASAVGSVLLVYSVRRHLRYLLPFAVLAGLALPGYMNLEHLTDRYSTLVDVELGENDGSLVSRAAAIRTGIELFEENPILGVGRGRFRYEAVDHTGGLIDMRPHDTYTAVASEMGLVGLAAHGFLLVLVVRLLWVGWRRARHSADERDAIAGGAAALLGGLVMGFAADFTTFPVVYVWLGVMLVRVGPVSSKVLRPVLLPSDNAPVPGPLRPI
ncbi:MAG: O-antigen ligase family protein [Proteobacteria bacterium]|nr:O-antigen ligase family protein [Pseudomonadota bacterium]